MRYRSDKDSLGTVKIPANAYYGPFTGRAIKQYHVTEQNPHPYLIKSFVMIKRSAAIANMKTKTLDRKRGNAIVKACDKILAGKYQDEFVVDMINSGAGTAFNMNTNEVIANVALKILHKGLGQYKHLHPNDHVNMSQSSNDTYPTAMNMSTLFALNTLLPIISKLTKSLAKKAKQFSKYKKIGRTHLMDALPVTLGSEFDAYVTSITKSSHAIIHSKKQLEQVALGGTAVGTGANSPKRYRKIAIQELAKISKLGLVEQKNMQHSLQSKFAIANTSSAIRNFAVELGKISNDIRLMASGPIAGLGELEIPAVHAGSSIMPAKVNPVIPEVVNQIAFKVIGNDLTITFAAEAGQLQLNVMEPVIAISLNESIELLTHAIQSLDEKCVRGIKAHEQACHDAVMRSVGIITLLDPLLGHALCDEIGKQCIAENKTIQEVVLERELLTQEQLDEIFSFENLVSEVDGYPVDYVA